MIAPPSLRAISLWQPWASLWASGRKVHETRHWPTEYRGLIVIHAAQKFVKEVEPALREVLDDEFGGHWGIDLPRGALVGTCSLVACKPIRVSDRGTTNAANDDDEVCGNWQPGRYAWEGADFRPFKRPIPWKGRQGFFRVPSAVAHDAVPT